MNSSIYVVKLRVALRDPMRGSDGRAVVGYYRVHWVAAPSAEAALHAAESAVDDGVVCPELHSVECNGDELDVGGDPLVAPDGDAVQLLRRSGRIFFPED